MRILLLVLAAGLLLPASAGAHAVVTLSGTTILYWAGDATSQSTVEVVVEPAAVRLSDRTVDGGIDPGRCDPGAVDEDGYIVEVTCPRDADTRLRIDVGPRDDSIAVREGAGAPPLPTLLLAGPGADRLTGGAGIDVLDGGGGTDSLEGGPGDDELRARDGAIEVVGCGDGADRAYVDSADLPEACEEVVHADPPPPPGAEPGPSGAPPDTEPPDVDARARRRQRIGRPAALVATAEVDEVAQLTALAKIRLGRRRLTFSSPQRRVETPGARVRLVLRATPATARALRRALRRGRRKIYAVVTVVAIDDAANSEAVRLPRVKLRPARRRGHRR